MIINPKSLLAHLSGDCSGTALIETAIVAPTLLLMCVGGFEIATMVEKQSRLQSTAELATEIVMVSNPDTELERLAVESELSGSLASSGTIEVTFRYRCGANALSETPPSGCEEEELATYLHIALTDWYEPVWTQWGIGSAFEYDVQRTVQVS
jgi:hypothetical protein